MAAVDAANAAAASGSGGKADCFTADFSGKVGGGGSGSSSCGHGSRTFGGSPSLNAAAAALAERHALVDTQGNTRPQEQGQGKRCRDGGGGGGGGVGAGGGSSSSGLRKDVEGLSEDIRRLRGELVASHEQNVSGGALCSVLCLTPPHAGWRLFKRQTHDVTQKRVPCGVGCVGSGAWEVTRPTGLRAEKPTQAHASERDRRPVDIHHASRFALCFGESEGLAKDCTRQSR